MYLRLLGSPRLRLPPQLKATQAKLRSVPGAIDPDTEAQLASLEAKVEELLEERASLQEAVRSSPRSSAAVEHTLKKREAEIKALERELKNAQAETRKQVDAAIAQTRRELESSSGNKSDQIEDPLP